MEKVTTPSLPLPLAEKVRYLRRDGFVDDPLHTIAEQHMLSSHR